MESVYISFACARQSATDQKLTILDEFLSNLILLSHQSEVERSTIPDLIISVIQASCKKNRHASLNLRVLLSNAKFGQCCNSGSPNQSVFQNHSVVNIPDILGWLRGLRAFYAKQMQNSYRKLRELAVLDKLAQVSERCLWLALHKNSCAACERTIFLAFRNELNKIEHALNHASFELITTLVPKNTAQE